MSASGPQTAEVDSSRSAQQSRPDHRDVESLEALWRPSSHDDGRATLEQLQSAVAAQGTFNGLNGTAFIFVACVMHNLLQKVSTLIATVPMSCAHIDRSTTSEVLKLSCINTLSLVT